METPAACTYARLNISKTLRLHIICTTSGSHSYGWDWGPILMTAGPWRPISLHTYNTRITDLRIQAEVSESLDANIKVSLKVSSLTGQTAIALKDQTGLVVRKSDSLNIRDGETEVDFKGAKGDFDLWYPVGYGKQPIYTVQVQVTDEVRIMINSAEALRAHHLAARKYFRHHDAENWHS